MISVVKSEHVDTDRTFLRVASHRQRLPDASSSSSSSSGGPCAPVPSLALASHLLLLMRQLDAMQLIVVLTGDEQAAFRSRDVESHRPRPEMWYDDLVGRSESVDVVDMQAVV